MFLIKVLLPGCSPPGSWAHRCLWDGNLPGQSGLPLLAAVDLLLRLENLCNTWGELSNIRDTLHDLNLRLDSQLLRRDFRNMYLTSIWSWETKLNRKPEQTWRWQLFFCFVNFGFFFCSHPISWQGQCHDHYIRFPIYVSRRASQRAPEFHHTLPYICTYIYVLISTRFKEYSTSLVLHSCNIIRLMVDKLKGFKLTQEDHRCFIKTWRLHYPQCNVTSDSWTWYSGVLC